MCADQGSAPYLNLGPEKGLSDYGKEVMLRVMARVQRLKTADHKAYTKVRMQEI